VEWKPHLGAGNVTLPARVRRCPLVSLNISGRSLTLPRRGLLPPLFWCRDCGTCRRARGGRATMVPWRTCPRCCTGDRTRACWVRNRLNRGRMIVRRPGHGTNLAENPEAPGPGVCDSWWAFKLLRRGGGTSDPTAPRVPVFWFALSSPGGQPGRAPVLQPPRNRRKKTPSS